MGFNGRGASHRDDATEHASAGPGTYGPATVRPARERSGWFLAAWPVAACAVGMEDLTWLREQDMAPDPGDGAALDAPIDGASRSAEAAPGAGDGDGAAPDASDPSDVGSADASDEPPADDGGPSPDGESREAGAQADGGGDAEARDAGTADAQTPDASAPDAAACTGDLSGIGTGDFHVDVTFKTTATAAEALLNQRAACGHGNFWDVRLEAGGLLRVETDDGTNYLLLMGTRALNDGTSHAVSVRRVAGVITVAVDGTSDASAISKSAFGTLAALRTKSDACDGTSLAVFAGRWRNVCVTSPTTPAGAPLRAARAPFTRALAVCVSVSDCGGQGSCLALSSGESACFSQ